MKHKLLANLMLGAAMVIPALFQAQSAPTASFSISSPTVCAQGAVQATDLSSDTPSAWSYSINGVPTSTNPNPEFTFTLAGTYTISFESSNGFGTSAVYTETVLVHALPVLSVTGNTQICTGTSDTLNVSGADQYVWSTGSNTHSTVITPLASGMYTVIGTSTLTGCEDSSFVSVSALPLPTITVSDATICPGTAYTISPSGGSTYTYSGGSDVVSPAVNTSYTVSGTDSQTGCSDSVVVSITVQAFSVSAAGGTICAGESFTIVPSGGHSYTYSGGSDVVSPTVTTSYTVTGTDVTASCSDVAVVTVTVSPAPVITVNSGSICAGQVFTITPSGAGGYTISGGSHTVSPPSGTTYVVSGTDPATGCTGVATLSLDVIPLPVVTVNSGTICAGEVFTMVPSGAASYTFSNGSPTVSPAADATYTITGASAEGCVAQGAAVATVVISGTQPTVAINTTSATTVCRGESVVLVASGASNYTWSTGETSASITISPTGTMLYSVMGLDVLSGCYGSASVLKYVVDCTGIEALTPLSALQVYPNPALDVLTIDSPGSIQVVLRNALGVLVSEHTLQAGQNEISVSDLPAGVYFMGLKQAGDGKVLRIVKH